MLVFKAADNGWRYGVGLHCRLFHLTTNLMANCTIPLVVGMLKIRN